MTNLQVFTGLWNWRSPAWWVALAATGVYFVVTWWRHASPRQIGLFLASAAAFVIALASPLAFLASRYLFSAHMAQHLLLLLIVPLFAMLAWPPSRERVSAAAPRKRSPGAVALAWAAGVGAMWFWHIPALCTAAMRSPLVFDAQAVSLVAAGVAFWLPVFFPVVARRMQPHLAAAYLFTGCLGCSLLGIYVTFSPAPVCPLYLAPPASPELLDLIRGQWGLSHRLDQQIGGLLMWVPACLIYLGAILATMTRWYDVPYSTRSGLSALTAE